MFTGKEDHAITLDMAREMVRRWRDHGTALPGGPDCEFFARDILDKILAQEGCVGLRIYHGRNAKGQHVVVLVGADADGNDLVDGDIAEEGLPCPPHCSARGTLAG
jgi:hypothetical protein